MTRLKFKTSLLVMPFIFCFPSRNIACLSAFLLFRVLRVYHFSPGFPFALFVRFLHIDPPYTSLQSCASLLGMEQSPEPQIPQVDNSGPASAPASGPLKCNICQRTYSRIDHLARHFRSRMQAHPCVLEIVMQEDADSFGNW
jgi:hypothetical protein